jgi:hypothetical protein
VNFALVVAIAAPLAGAALLLTAPLDDPNPDTGWQRFNLFVVGLACLGALAAVVFVLVRTLQGSVLPALGAEADAWRAVLATGAVATCAAGLVRPARALDPRRDALVLAALAAGVASVFAADAAVFGGFLIVTTLAVCAGALDRNEPRARDAVRALCLSDLTAVAGLVLVSADGVRLAPGARGAGAALLLVAAAARLGLLPGARALEDLARARSGALVHGVVRAQGFVLAAWVGARGSDVATVMAVGAALLGAERARRAVRDASVEAALTAHAGLVLAGLGLRTPAALAGAALLAGGSFLASALAHLGRRSDGVPSYGAAPLGATLAGAALVAQAALARAQTDRGAYAVAIPAAAALLWLAIAGVSGLQQRRPRARFVFAAPVLAAVACIVVFPDVVLRHGAVVVARALGAAPTLRPLSGAIHADLGPVFAVAALAALLSQTARTTPVPRAFVEVYDGPAARVPRSAVALEVVALGWWGLLLGIAIHRGFL